jgi:cytochrome c-type biogenesis protein CcmH/NrfF
MPALTRFPHLLAAGLLAFHLAAGWTADAQPIAADPALEERVNRLSAELRCLVCQNQSLADSHADLAIDLKNQVREQLQSGRSEQDVIRYMTERYGDFVLYRPPVKATTVLLWAGPLLLLLLGGIVLWRNLNRNTDRDGPAPLDAQTAQRANELLAATDAVGPPHNP